MKQGCGGAAKITQLQFCPLQKMVNQTAHKNTGCPKSYCAAKNILTMAVFVTQY